MAPADGHRTPYTHLGKSEQNDVVRSLNRRLRDEWLNEILALDPGSSWKEDYNLNRIHSASAIDFPKSSSR
ncbi:MAG: hypothetical protein B7Y12_14490 [Rhizobiales bacterium 24-66-13]|nr:MAG: hypothetical protein B7Y95_21495 [Rhizobiales bacterium 32-66-11]OYY88254.1 MAG: hypothetical protein B7Y61_03055 [Rhizobiales bacterium 35-66-30]OYZ73884.1 MAG: hypothetical protein B7Y12_14490 [Rhizobiales bacterium 24-66-13]OZB07084.1 MAG: hypothetical protein B7X67_09390 [Rhizobiales bacterium 39-66-18]